MEIIEYEALLKNKILEQKELYKNDNYIQIEKINRANDSGSELLLEQLR
ncbi:MAG TPA: hypothetical protein VEP90_03985 [Methylomirabilota bacterium]|nr:hypothetical protein [Methylomirabilota bacterium]